MGNARNGDWNDTSIFSAEWPRSGGSRSALRTPGDNIVVDGNWFNAVSCRSYHPHCIDHLLREAQKIDSIWIVLSIILQKTMKDSKSYLGVAISEKGLGEIDGKRYLVHIPQSEITFAEVKYGSPAERPTMQLVAGAILAPLCFFGIYIILMNGLTMIRWSLGMLLFGGVGIWLIIEVLKKRHYLEVQTSKGNRKLVFKGKVENDKLDQFLQQLTDGGYNFRKRIEPGMNLAGDRVP